MSKRINRMGVIFVGILSVFSLLTGCGDNLLSGNKSKVEPKEGATLTGLFMSHQGMAMEPYYILRVSGENTYMKLTGNAPDGYYMTEEPDYDEVVNKIKANTGITDITPEEEIQYFAFIDEVRDCERASLVFADDEIIAKLTEVIYESGALTWNGYDKHRSMKHVSDSGDSYNLFLAFSDGSTVKVSSYNAHPDGWNDFFVKIRDIFEENADYSRYTD